MQGRNDEKWRRKGRRTEGKKGGDDEDYYRRGWMAGYERERRRILEQKEEEELEKKRNLELEFKELKRKQEEDGAEQEFRIRRIHFMCTILCSWINFLCTILRSYVRTSPSNAQSSSMKVLIWLTYIDP